MSRRSPRPERVRGEQSSHDMHEGVARVLHFAERTCAYSSCVPQAAVCLVLSCRSPSVEQSLRCRCGTRRMPRPQPQPPTRAMQQIAHVTLRGKWLSSERMGLESKDGSRIKGLRLVRMRMHTRPPRGALYTRPPREL